MLQLFRKLWKGEQKSARPPKAVPLTAARPNLETLESRDPAAALYALTNANAILRFDDASPTSILATVAIQGLLANERIVGMDFRPRTGQLFALGITVNGQASTGRLLTVDPLTGLTRQVGQPIANIVPANAANANAAYGFNFNPAVDAIRVINTADANFALLPNTGGQAVQTALNTPGNAAAARMIDSVTYDRFFDGRLGANGTSAFVINAQLGMLQFLGGQNGNPGAGSGQLTNIGPLNTPIDPATTVGMTVRTSGQPGGTGLAVFDTTPGAGVTFRLHSINLTTGTATPIGLVGAGTTPLVGVAAPQPNTIVTGITGGTVASTINVLDATTNQQRIPPITPFAGFNGALAVGSADVNRDSVPDVIVGAQAPNGHTKAFDGATGAQLASTFVFPGFNGTVSVAGGDVNGDGFHDLIVTAFGANAHVRAISGQDGNTILSSFFAYPGYLGPTTVGAADFDNDGDDEIVVGAGGPGINGRFGIFDNAGVTVNPGSFAFQGFNGAVNLAGGDVNGDGTPDILVGATGAPGGHTKIISGAAVYGGGAFVELGSFFAFEQSYVSGVSVGVADVNQNGRYEALVAPLANRATEVRAFDGLTNSQISSFMASSNSLGATVAGARF